MSDDDTCHLPNCEQPRATVSLCREHAEYLLAPLWPIRKPRKKASRAPANDTDERREAA